MTTRKHAPLPWRAKTYVSPPDAAYVADAKGQKVAVNGQHLHPANAALIVRAVNAHDGLVAALGFVQKYAAMQASKGNALPSQLTGAVDAALKAANEAGESE